MLKENLEKLTIFLKDIKDCDDCHFMIVADL